MIDLEAGRVALNGMTVTASLAEDEAIAAKAKPLVHNGAYRSYVLPEAEFDGRVFIPSLWFEDGRLTRLTLDYVDPEVSGWDDWSEQAFKAAHRGNERWLAARLDGATGRLFPWGDVRAVADPRSGSASIVLRFGR